MAGPGTSLAVRQRGHIGLGGVRRAVFRYDVDALLPTAQQIGIMRREGRDEELAAFSPPPDHLEEQVSPREVWPRVAR
jgi:hypothetical protein